MFRQSVSATMSNAKGSQSCLVVIVVLFGLLWCANSPADQVTFNYAAPGGQQTWDVPLGVT